VFGFKKKKNKKQIAKLGEELATTDARLALLKVQLAAQMIKLAEQTDDLSHLFQAEEVLAASRKNYTFEKTPIEICMVQVALGNCFFRLGREKADKSALTSAREAYRAAITVASVYGDDKQRDALRDRVKLVEAHLGRRNPTPPLFRVA